MWTNQSRLRSTSPSATCQVRPPPDDDEAPDVGHFRYWGPSASLRKRSCSPTLPKGCAIGELRALSPSSFPSSPPGLRTTTCGRGLARPRLDPTTGKEMGGFSEDDPRGRRRGALRAQLRDCGRDSEWHRAWHADMPRRDGGPLRLRREALRLSVDAVAERAGFDPAWLLEVEAGQASEVRRSQWVELVWATQEGWPDLRRSRLTGVDAMWGWLPGLGGLSTAEALVKAGVEGGLMFQAIVPSLPRPRFPIMCGQ
jgi:transcriptional regulator with XRE-family HTH domain